MEEKRFKELLLENNIYLNQEMDARMDKTIKENNEYLIQEMDTRMDKKIKENNEYLIQEMDTKMDKKIKENNEYLIQEMDNKLVASERRQNQKLAKLEHTYGEKINAIFDKLVSMEEVLLDTRAICIGNQNKLKEHEDKLFSHDFRISKLESQFNS